MQYAQKVLLAVSAALVVVLGCASIKKNDRMADAKQDPVWARIDSLASLGQYTTALEATQAVLASAHAGRDWRTEFRAWMYKGRFMQYTGVEQKAIIAALESRAATAETPLKQLLQSVVAGQWWGYYQQNRWRIMDRTNLAEATDDPDTWDQANFMRKVIAGYAASLEPADGLSAIPVGELAPLLEPEHADLRLRPSLFDLLAHRALEVFRNSETRLAEHAGRFQLNEPQAFAAPAEFATAAPASADSTAWHWQAMQLYRQLTALHLHDAAPEALTVLTLDRLGFVRENSTLPGKDSLYLNALQALQASLPTGEASAEVRVAIAQWHADQGAQFQRLAPDSAWKWEKKTAAGICNEVIAQAQAPFAVQKANALLAQLQRPSLDLTTEQAVLPDAPFKLAVTYANVKQLWLRMVVNNEPDAPYRGFRDGEAQKLWQLPALHAWSVQLPDDGDLNAHLTELAVEALPLGAYHIIASNTEQFMATSLVSVCGVQVTRLAMAERHVQGRTAAVLVMDRSTGVPQKGVTAVVSRQEYQGGAWRFRTIGTATTDADGLAQVALPKDNQGQFRWTLTQGRDRITSGDSYFWNYGEAGNTDTLRTFLFTDRAIYRPGQPVLFKGIVTVKRGTTTEVKAGYGTVVKFFDVNRQPIDSLQVKTDAYGAFHGQFTAPEGTLTGSMRIEEANGSQPIQVEEYKRPTFEVLFPESDSATAEAAPKLGAMATVHGLARSYAGVPLDGATVQWTVRREARMPWWCGTFWRSFIPWGQPVEVASGTAETDGSGNFKVNFLAQADKAISRKADPTFAFTVEASITDVNGETQTNTTGISVGYRSINIALEVEDGMDRSTVDSLKLNVQDLNGNVLDVPMDVRIARLHTPGVPLRERLWERPDVYVIAPEEYKKLFPQNVYTTGDDPLTWPRVDVVLERKNWTANGHALPLAGMAKWDVGAYLIEVGAKDADGKEVKVQKVVSIYDPAVQHTGFVNEAFHVEALKAKVEPGEKAQLLLSSALPEAHILMEVEREGQIAVRRWFTLKDGQQLVELPVLEADRGGFSVHFLCAERGLSHKQDVFIDVPWSNKDLQVEWMTFRDKLLPGAKEEWRLKITGPKGEKVAAQLLAGMYDASLDHFVPHGWDMSIWATYSSQLGWGSMEPFGTNGSITYGHQQGLPQDTAHVFPALNTYGFGGFGDRYLFADGVVMQAVRSKSADAPMAPPGQGNFVQDETSALEETGANKKLEAKSQSPAQNTKQPATRTDFRETAFFFPDLLTDKDGSVILRFTMPDALTRWKLLGLAHTTDLKTAQFTKEVITQKPLMVTPNLPRFLREGDKITLTSKVNVVEGGTVTGQATMELFDPFTNASLNDRFGLKNNGVPFTAGPGASALVAWDIAVPEGISTVAVRISAKAGPFTDAEQRPLPILTDRVLVTESLPLPISKAGTKTFTLDKLMQDTSSTLRHQSLKLEFTPNPAWYAVQALPYLMEYPHQCSEQVFSRLYANSLAAHNMDERPKIKDVFAQWSAKGTGNEGAFLSKLEKNSELKNIILAETPWVLNARNESESKQRIALLFDMQRMAAERGKALKQLRDAQLGNGAWPWFSGMQPSRWVTQSIVAGFGHLEKLGAADLRPDGQTQVMLKQAVHWLDNDLEADYKRLLKETTKEQRDKYMPGHNEVQFLYARSFFPRWAITGGTSTAVDFYKQRLAATWLQFGLQEQAMIALALHRLGDDSTAQLIMRSLGERATHSEELGMYWKNFSAGYHWWDFPTETHALLIEAFHEVAKDQQAVNELRLYLLKLKQTTDWKTTKATAEACYALLLTGDDWLEDAGTPKIAVGGEAVVAGNQEAGTGYFTKTWPAEAIKPAMGQVTVTTTADRAAWGALYWQYFEQMDKVTTAESPFSIKKQVLLNTATDAGAKLVALDKARALKPGDKLTVRIELRTDRAMDYVHLKDLRAAGLEPTETLSGYRFQGGLGYYQSTRDAATDFFFDHMEPGTYVFEYELRVSHEGNFSNGITTAMCLYAPEFSAHSEGVRVVVGGRP
ncbi:MAG: hypothetical protein KBF80_06275 [Flavobacteriales bacterium]|nr:hypothetical protein [Flavobacteriales bacterium]